MSNRGYNTFGEGGPTDYKVCFILTFLNFEQNSLDTVIINI